MSELPALEVDNVFKIATSDTRVRGFLAERGWDLEGKDQEMEMDVCRNRKTGKRVCVEDISDGFPVTFLMGEIGLSEFDDMARSLTPGVKLLEVDSSWEGEATTIVVAMTEAQVKDMFGKRSRMGELPASKRRVARVTP